MITNGIHFKNFQINKKFKQITKDLYFILNKKNQVIQSLTSNYKNSFDVKILNKYKRLKSFRLIGMGGSSLELKLSLTLKNKKEFLFCR